MHLYPKQLQQCLESRDYKCFWEHESPLGDSWSFNFLIKKNFTNNNSSQMHVPFDLAIPFLGIYSTEILYACTYAQDYLLQNWL